MEPHPLARAFIRVLNSSSSFLERCADSLQGLDVLDEGCAHIHAQAQPTGFADYLGGGFWLCSLGAIVAVMLLGRKAGALSESFAD